MPTPPRPVRGGTQLPCPVNNSQLGLLPLGVGWTTQQALLAPRPADGLQLPVRPVEVPVGRRLRALPAHHTGGPRVGRGGVRQSQLGPGQQEAGQGGGGKLPSPSGQPKGCANSHCILSVPATRWAAWGQHRHLRWHGGCAYLRASAFCVMGNMNSVSCCCMDCRPPPGCPACRARSRRTCTWRRSACRCAACPQSSTRLLACLPACLPYHVLARGAPPVRACVITRADAGLREGLVQVAGVPL